MFQKGYTWPTAYWFYLGFFLFFFQNKANREQGILKNMQISNAKDEVNKKKIKKRNSLRRITK